MALRLLQPCVRLSYLTAILIFALGGFDSVAHAQRGGFGGGGGGRGMPTPEESFQRMDRNQNGLLDPDEIQQLPGFLKDMYARAGVDGSRALNLQEFQGASQKLREQFEQGRSSGQSQFRRPDGGGGGPPPGEMRPPGGDSDRRETARPDEPADGDIRREDRKREDRDSSSRGSSKDSPSSKSAKKDKKPKPRVTKDLPDEYRERDKNNDGQVALHEWERSAFAKFYELDRNGDGLLTPSELLPPPTKSDKDKKGAATATSTSTSASAESKSGSSTAATSDNGKPAEPAKSASDAKPAVTDSSPGAIAFQSLDVNKDGQLTQDEWERSRNTRRRFEKAKITVTLPVKQAQFVELYRKTED